MIVDLREVRNIAWDLAWWYSYDWDRTDHPDRKYLKGANTIRDLCDEVEALRAKIANLTHQRDGFLQNNIELHGGFYGPRSEIESHQRAEIEFLKHQYRRDTGNEPEEYS